MEEEYISIYEYFQENQKGEFTSMEVERTSIHFHISRKSKLYDSLRIRLPLRKLLYFHGGSKVEIEVEVTSG